MKPWVQRAVDELPPAPRDVDAYDWQGRHARPEQRWPDGAWSVWLYLAGRGSGKTRTAAENVRYALETLGYPYVYLVGRTSADVRDVMIEGPTGILKTSPPWFRPIYLPSKRKLIWPNGAYGLCFSGDEPDQLRGPQTPLLWMDELATIPKDAYDNARMGLRVGKSLGLQPRMLATTTPRPLKIIRDLLKKKSTVVSRSTTWDNAENLPEDYLQELRDMYEGTRLGRQELEGELLDDIQGALFALSNIEKNRWLGREVPPLRIIYIGLDPSTTDSEDSDECGLVVVGMGFDGYGYVLADHSGRMAPGEWAAKAAALQRTYPNAIIVAEVNQGGDLVKDAIVSADKDAYVKTVRANKSKELRALPLSVLYQRDRIRHVGVHGHLEDQITSWVPEKGAKSPDRLDALVWGFALCLELLQQEARRALPEVKLEGIVAEEKRLEENMKARARGRQTSLWNIRLKRIS